MDLEKTFKKSIATINGSKFFFFVFTRVSGPTYKVPITRYLADLNRVGEGMSSPNQKFRPTSLQHTQLLHKAEVCAPWFEPGWGGRKVKVLAITCSTINRSIWSRLESHLPKFNGNK